MKNNNQNNTVIDVLHSRHFFAQRYEIIATLMIVVCTVFTVYCAHRYLVAIDTALHKALYMRGFTSDTYLYNKTRYVQQDEQAKQNSARELWQQSRLLERIKPWTIFETIIVTLSPKVRLVDFVYPFEGEVSMHFAARSLSDFMVWLKEEKLAGMCCVQKIAMLDGEEIIATCSMQKNNKDIVHDGKDQEIIDT
jgi:hypothetical protein